MTWLLEAQVMNEAFVALVAHMRAIQQEWFKTKPENRPPDLLRQCKEVEGRVDKAIERFLNKQQSLFEE
jgi:hypothetical protein